MYLASLETGGRETPSRETSARGTSQAGGQARQAVVSSSWYPPWIPVFTGMTIAKGFVGRVNAGGEVHAVFLCETSDDVLFVFPDAFGTAGSHAGVERSVVPTCEDVNGRLSLVSGIPTGSPLSPPPVIPAKAGIQGIQNHTNSSRRSRQSGFLLSINSNFRWG